MRKRIRHHLVFQFFRPSNKAGTPQLFSEFFKGVKSAIQIKATLGVIERNVALTQLFFSWFYVEVTCVNGIFHSRMGWLVEFLKNSWESQKKFTTQNVGGVNPKERSLGENSDVNHWDDVSCGWGGGWYCRLDPLQRFRAGLHGVFVLTSRGTCSGGEGEWPLQTLEKAREWREFTQNCGFLVVDPFVDTLDVSLFYFFCQFLLKKS